MWGNDYPHDEGTFPFTRETLRAVFEGYDVGELSALLGGNAASLYGFELTKLAAYAQQHGPTVAEIAEPLVEMPERPNQALLAARAAR
jgi:hypothetical protein